MPSKAKATKRPAKEAIHPREVERRRLLEERIAQLEAESAAVPHALQSPSEVEDRSYKVGSRVLVRFTWHGDPCDTGPGTIIRKDPVQSCGAGRVARHVCALTGATIPEPARYTNLRWYFLIRLDNGKETYRRSEELQEPDVLDKLASVL